MLYTIGDYHSLRVTFGFSFVNNITSTSRVLNTNNGDTTCPDIRQYQAWCFEKKLESTFALQNIEAVRGSRPDGKVARQQSPKAPHQQPSFLQAHQEPAVYHAQLEDMCITYQSELGALRQEKNDGAVKGHCDGLEVR